MLLLVWCSTIVYELMMLEYPYKSCPLMTQIWLVGTGKVQELVRLPKGKLRSIIARCWKETPNHRPTFKDILANIEHDVSMWGGVGDWDVFVWVKGWGTVQEWWRCYAGVKRGSFEG